MNKILVHRIDAAIRFFLFVLIFWLPYSNAVVEWSLIFSILLWLCKRGIMYYELCRDKDGLTACTVFRFKGSGTAWFVILFLLICLISAAGSAFPQIALKGLFSKTLEWFLIFFLVIEVFTSRRHFKILWIVFLLTSIATCLDAMIQYHGTGVDIFRKQTLARGGATAGFHHANQLGSYLTITIPLLLSGCVQKMGGRLHKGLWVAMAIAVWAMVLTFSRASWFSLLLGLVVMALMCGKKRYVFAFACLVAVALLASRRIPEDTLKRYRVDHDNIASTWAWRKGLWMDSLRMIQDRPLFGHGTNTYMRLFQDYRRKFEGHHDFDPTYAHNCYVQMAAEIGVIGLCAFWALIGRIFWMIIRAVRLFGPDPDPLLRGLLIGTGSGMAAFLGHSLLDVNFYSLQLAAFFWFMAGMAVAIYNLGLQQALVGHGISQKGKGI